MKDSEIRSIETTRTKYRPSKSSTSSPKASKARPIVLPKIPNLNTFTEESKTKRDPEDDDKKPFIQHMRTLD